MQPCAILGEEDKIMFCGLTIHFHLLLCMLIFYRGKTYFHLRTQLYSASRCYRIFIFILVLAKLYISRFEVARTFIFKTIHHPHRLFYPQRRKSNVRAPLLIIFTFFKSHMSACVYKIWYEYK